MVIEMIIYTLNYFCCVCVEKEETESTITYTCRYDLIQKNCDNCGANVNDCFISIIFLVVFKF